jgi:hypothetical protein
MMYGPRRMMGAAIACLLSLAAASGQPAQKLLMAEDVFKNVQVLKGIPVNQFMETIGFASATRREAGSPIKAAGMIGNSLQM